MREQNASLYIARQHQLYEDIVCMLASALYSFRYRRTAMVLLHGFTSI